MDRAYSVCQLPPRPATAGGYPSADVAGGLNAHHGRWICAERHGRRQMAAGRHLGPRPPRAVAQRPGPKKRMRDRGKRSASRIPPLARRRMKSAPPQRRRSPLRGACPRATRPASRWREAVITLSRDIRPARPPIATTVLKNAGANLAAFLMFKAVQPTNSPAWSGIRRAALPGGRPPRLLPLCHDPFLRGA